jgi:hypothetical protein
MQNVNHFASFENYVRSFGAKFTKLIVPRSFSTFLSPSLHSACYEYGPTSTGIGQFVSNTKLIGALTVGLLNAHGASALYHHPTALGFDIVFLGSNIGPHLIGNECQSEKGDKTSKCRPCSFRTICCCAEESANRPKWAIGPIVGMMAVLALCVALAWLVSKACTKPKY